MAWEPWGGLDEPESLPDFVVDAHWAHRLINPQLFVGGSPPETPTERREHLERLWDRLRRRKLPYRFEPWSPGTSQWIRDPRWFDAESGTCVDFCVVFAAICQVEHISVSLVVLSDRPTARAATRAHCALLVDLNRDRWASSSQAAQHLREQLASSAVLDLSELPEVLENAISSGEFIALDVVQASRSEDFAFAVAEGRKCVLFDYDVVRVVDVAARHLTHPPHEPLSDLDRPAISRGVAQLPDDIATYAARPELDEVIHGHRGCLVLHGPSGRGKSVLALLAAGSAPGGSAWFLNGSDRQTLTKELARMEAAERFTPEKDISTADDASALAGMALARLRRPAPWLVVVDNANGHPGALADLLPRPSGEQCLVITTTNSDEWVAAAESNNTRRGASVWRCVEVDSFSDEQMLQLGCPGELTGLAEGRPLFGVAFGRLARLAGRRGEELRSRPLDGEGDPAARLLWSEASRLLPADAPLGRAAAWLSPDAIPQQALGQVLGERGTDLEAAVERLADAGVIRAQGDAVWMHRLVGEVARAATPDSEVAQFIGSPGFYEDGASRADDETVTNAVQRLLHCGLEPLAKALPLANVMALLEPRNRVEQAASLAGHIVDWLEQAEDGGTHHQLILGDALHAMARWANQNSAADRKQRLEGREKAVRARSIRESHGDLVLVAKSDALISLLDKALIDRRAPRDEQYNAYLGVVADLERSLHARRQALGDHVETARAIFNLAGPKIEMSQLAASRSDAAQLLREADEAYEEARTMREILYNTKTHIHIAASIAGTAMAAYYRALYVRTDLDEQVHDLRNAHRLCLESLDMRASMDGAVDGEDTKKSLDLLAKIDDARVAVQAHTNARTTAARTGGEMDVERVRSNATAARLAEWRRRQNEFAVGGLVAVPQDT